MSEEDPNKKILVRVTFNERTQYSADFTMTRADFEKYDAIAWSRRGAEEVVDLHLGFDRTGNWQYSSDPEMDEFEIVEDSEEEPEEGETP